MKSCFEEYPYLEDVLDQSISNYKKYLCAEYFGQYNKSFPVDELNKYDFFYQTRLYQMKNIFIIDKNNRLTKEFRDIIVPKPDMDTYSFISLLSTGIGNCVPSAVLANLLLREVDKLDFQIVKLVKSIHEEGHMILEDTISEVEYHFTIDPFIVQQNTNGFRREIQNEKDLVKYFYEIGKNKSE